MGKDWAMEDRRDAADALFSKVLTYVKRAYQGDSFYDFLLNAVRQQGFSINNYSVDTIETDDLGAGTVRLNLELSSYDATMTISKKLEFK